MIATTVLPERVGSAYVWDSGAVGFIMRANHLVRERDGLRARIEVTCNLPGWPEFVHRARYSLEGTTTVDKVTKAIALAAPTGDTNALRRSEVEQFTRLVTDLEEQGKRFIMDQDTPALIRRPDVIERLLPAVSPTQWYGAGGAGKGWLAMGACVAVQGAQQLAGLDVLPGKALYLDWEDDHETFLIRRSLISRGMGLSKPPAVTYRECRGGGSLYDQIDPIIGYIDQHGITLTVIDSVMMAAGGSSEHAGYEESARKLMEAVSMMNCTVLLIDHINANGKDSKGVTGRSYGSVLKGNTCRCTWEIQKEQAHGAAESHVAAFHTKANHTALHAPIGLHLDFHAPDRVIITREAMEQSPVIESRLSITQRIQHILRDGRPRDKNELAEIIGGDATPDTVGQALSRGKGRWCQVHDAATHTPGGVAKWVLSGHGEE